MNPARSNRPDQFQNHRRPRAVHAERAAADSKGCERASRLVNVRPGRRGGSFSNRRSISRFVITHHNYQLALPLLLKVVNPMKIQSFLYTHSYPRFLLLVPAIGFLAFAGCASAAGTAGTRPTVNALMQAVGKHSAYDHVTTCPRTYNPETENLDRSWPFGPESNAP